MKQNNQCRYQPAQDRMMPYQNGGYCNIPTFEEDLTRGAPLAMIYAPEQTFTDIYEDEEGLSRGTIFADLYFPFEACGGMAR